MCIINAKYRTQCHIGCHSSKLTYNNIIRNQGKRQMIDNGPYLLKGWAFYLANCQVYNKICLSAQYSLEAEIIRAVSNNTAGTTMNGVFGVLINRERDEFSLISNNIVVG
jgi:hypothetical protein